MVNAHHYSIRCTQTLHPGHGVIDNKELSVFDLSSTSGVRRFRDADLIRDFFLYHIFLLTTAASDARLS